MKGVKGYQRGRFISNLPFERAYEAKMHMTIDLTAGIVYDTGEMMRKLTPLEIVKGIEVIDNIYEDGHLLANQGSQ